MSTMLADKLDIVISLIVGIVVTLYGFGAFGTPQDRAPAAAQQQSFTRLAKWLGPILAAVSAIRLLLP